MKIYTYKIIYRDDEQDIEEEIFTTEVEIEDTPEEMESIARERAWEVAEDASYDYAATSFDIQLISVD